jgi:hypothetical protein
MLMLADFVLRLCCCCLLVAGMLRVLPSLDCLLQQQQQQQQHLVLVWTVGESRELSVHGMDASICFVTCSLMISS